MEFMVLRERNESEQMMIISSVLQNSQCSRLQTGRQGAHGQESQRVKIFQEKCQFLYEAISRTQHNSVFLWNKTRKMPQWGIDKGWIRHTRKTRKSKRNKKGRLCQQLYIFIADCHKQGVKLISKRKMQKWQVKPMLAKCIRN